VGKDQAVDDVDEVLEILIRTGELPASAVMPLVPKSEAQTSVSDNPLSVQADQIQIPASSSQIMLPLHSDIQMSPQYVVSSSPANVASNMSSTVDVTLPVMQQEQSSPLGALLGTGLREQPLPLSVASPMPLLESPVFTSDLASLPDPLPSLGDLPFTSMDWSDSDVNILPLDGFPDVLDTADANKVKQEEIKETSSSIPVSSMNGMGDSIHGSEPNLNGIYLGDGDPMNIDVSDWLDVIMPSTGLTPLSANAPVHFPSDPLLTPKPQDVLELFNMDETDLHTPTDMGAGMTFEKAMETVTSSHC